MAAHPFRWFAQPTLAIAGAVALALVPLGLVWAAGDHRLVHGELVALKPIKFAASIGVYLLTASWMLGYACPDRLGSTPVQLAIWGLLAGAGTEFACIVLQAMRGRVSHFNLGTPFEAAVSALMGVTAILFVGALLPLAWEIARRPRGDADPLMIVAVVAGLATTVVLGGLSGAGMGRIASGAVARHDLVLPWLGWRLADGTVRIAHFLGIHAMQAFPLIAAASLPVRRADPWPFAAAAAGYTIVTLTLLYHVPRAAVASLTVPVAGFVR